MVELQPNIVFHGRHFVCHIVICNPICVKLIPGMSGVIPHNLKKRRLYLKPFSGRPQTRHTQTDRHTHTHDDSIRRNAMRCISPKNVKIMFAEFDICHRLASMRKLYSKCFANSVPDYALWGPGAKRFCRAVNY